MKTSTRVVERKQPVTITALVKGEIRHVRTNVTIVDTFHLDGRKDCIIKVPRLQIKPQLKSGA